MSPDRYLRQAKQIVASKLVGYAIDAYLFGSRATGKATRYSDIDIALLSTAPMRATLVSDLKETFEESVIPYHVDVVDLSIVSEEFRQKVLQEGVLWYDSSKSK
jgi:predicted nucleotidyltransferase